MGGDGGKSAGLQSEQPGGGREGESRESHGNLLFGGEKQQEVNRPSDVGLVKASILAGRARAPLPASPDGTPIWQDLHISSLRSASVLRVARAAAL